jgi:hypothetical protein
MALVPVHLLPHPVRESVKNALHEKAPRGNLFNIPNTTGVGIGDGHVKITVTQEHPLHGALPKEINGIPVVIETRPPITHQQIANVEGGVAFAGRNTLFGVVVDSTGARFLMGCAHSFAYLTGGQVVIGGKTVGQFTRSALKCGDTNSHLDASIAAVSPGVSTSFDVVGLGTPKGIAEPVVGQGANMQGIAGGKKRGTITTTNYDYNDTYPEFNNCSVGHKDLFETNNSGIAGDSGSAVWNDQGYIMGIHFAGSANGSIGLQGNAKYFQSDLGVHLGVGAPQPVTLHTGSTAAPALNPTPFLLGGAALLGLMLFVK